MGENCIVRFASICGLVGGLVVSAAACAPEVRVFEVAEGPLVKTVVASGRVLPAAQVELGVRAPASALEVRVDEGDAVKAGEVLVRLEDTEAMAAVAQARASVAQAAAQLRKLKRVGGPLAQAALSRAEVEVTSAEEELGRAKDLANAGAYTSAQLSAAKEAVALARSRRTAAALELQSLTTGGDDRHLAMASLAQAEAAVALADARLDQTRLTAPVDGVVLRRNVEPGDLVQPGKPLLVIGAGGPTRIVMEPDERNLAHLRLGQHAIASTEAFPEQQFKAEVSFIAPAVDPSRGTIEVHLDVENPPDNLRAEMTASIEVTVAELESTIAVPDECVRDAATSGPFVLVVKNGTTVRRPVHVGLRGERLIEVTRGLETGEILVMDRQIQAGVKVDAVKVRPEVAH